MESSTTELAGDDVTPETSGRNEESSGGLPPPALEAISDPNVVDKLLDELKSQGMFDQIRKDCLAEVDTKVSSCSRHLHISALTN